MADDLRGLGSSSPAVMVEHTTMGLQQQMPAQRQETLCTVQ
jgi:hypothetical protein